MIVDTSPRFAETSERGSHEDRADAVRYAVLQRMAPAIRHDMVVNLQPIGMIYELIEHRMAAQEHDIHALEETASKMSRFAKAALAACVNTVTWLERDPHARTTVAEGVGESIAMLGRTFGFMGFKLINKVGDSDAVLPRDAVRHTLTAAMLAAADTADGPADVVLHSVSAGPDLALSLTLVPQTGQRTRQPFEETYRRLNWGDVEAVAEAESVGFVRHNGGATLYFRT